MLAAPPAARQDPSLAAGDVGGVVGQDVQRSGRLQQVEEGGRPEGGGEADVGDGLQPPDPVQAQTVTAITAAVDETALAADSMSATIGAIREDTKSVTHEIDTLQKDVAEVDVVRLRRGMGYVVQSGGLLPHLSVAANVGLLCQLEGWSAERRASRVGALLESVQLEPATFARRFPHELSGGQRQRVGLARALALDPPILLMDEPFGALDPIIRREVRAEFAALQRSLGKTVLLVTHDVREAFELADEVAVMAEGRLLQLAAPEELLARPANGFVESFIAEARRG